MGDGARGTIFPSTTITEAVFVSFVSAVSTTFFTFHGERLLHSKHSFSAASER